MIDLEKAYFKELPWYIVKNIYPATYQYNTLLVHTCLEYEKKTLLEPKNSWRVLIRTDEDLEHACDYCKVSPSKDITCVWLLHNWNTLYY